MFYRLSSRFHMLWAIPGLVLLVGCFETQEKEKKVDDAQTSLSGTVIEDRFEKEIAALESLSLSGASLEGLWLVFYSEKVPSSGGESIGIDAWTLLEISHGAESTSLGVSNYTNCQTNTPESYQYTIDTSTIRASSFRISHNHSFLYPAAADDVVVKIDESGRMLEFADYARVDEATTIKMKAYKARDGAGDTFGVYTLDGKEYEVSCLSYTDSWVLIQAAGDDIRQSEQALIGSGSANLRFSIIEFDQSDSDPDSGAVSFITADIEADSVSEKFSTDRVGGVQSTITLNINSNLSIDSSFSRSDGLEAELDVALLSVTP